MKNIKDKFKDILPEVNCRERQEGEKDSDYISEVYPSLDNVLSDKRMNKNEEKGKRKADIINKIYEENARLLNSGWENYIELEKAKAKDSGGDWGLVYNRKQLSKLYKLDLKPLKCPFCGIDECTTLDHFLPKDRYLLLSTTPFNLIPSCYTCNMKKGDYDPAEETGFFNPYLDESNSNWLSIEDFKLCDSSLQIIYKINNQDQEEKIENTAFKLDLLKRYENKANQFILNEKNEIKKCCSDENEIKDFFKNILDSISVLNLDDDNWLKVLCAFVQEESSLDARKLLKKYCTISNRWILCKDDVRGPGYKESLNDYLNYIGNDEERNIYFLSDTEFKRKIVCISNEIEHVSLEKETSLNVFVPGVVDVSDCKDAGFYVFDSQGCTGIRYKCIGCEHGVIVLKKDA